MSYMILFFWIFALIQPFYRPLRRYSNAALFVLLKKNKKWTTLVWNPSTVQDQTQEVDHKLQTTKTTGELILFSTLSPLDLAITTVMQM